MSRSTVHHARSNQISGKYWRSLQTYNLQFIAWTMLKLDWMEQLQNTPHLKLDGAASYSGYAYTPTKFIHSSRSLLGTPADQGFFKGGWLFTNVFVYYIVQALVVFTGEEGFRLLGSCFKVGVHIILGTLPSENLKSWSLLDVISTIIFPQLTMSYISEKKSSSQLWNEQWLKFKVDRRRTYRKEQIFFFC